MEGWPNDGVGQHDAELEVPLLVSRAVPNYKQRAQHQATRTGQSHDVERGEALCTRRGHDLAWQDTCMRAGNKIILDGVHGAVAAGTLCAVLGPSGAGKTSLLNLLAGRVSSRSSLQVGGSITLDRRLVDPTDMPYRSRIAYVAQEDAMTPSATPREALRFSVALRRPELSRDQVESAVEAMLQRLGIAHCADTRIAEGLSSGERKRTAVGLELVTAPQVLFLDEPTSGLDSFAAFTCMQLLQKVARQDGCAVLCTLHQPSSEIVDMFDSLILMAHGRVVYAGPASQCAHYFTEKSLACPPQYNLADHIVFLVQKMGLEELEAKSLFCPRPGSLLPPPPLSPAKHDKHLPTTHAPFLTQLAWLSKRELQSAWRGGWRARAVSTVFLNVLFGLMFFGAGSQDDSLPANLHTHFGAIMFTCLSAMFGAASPALLAFPLVRPIFLREYSTGTYGLPAYLLSTALVEFPITFFFALLQWVSVYFLVPLRGHFLLQVLVAWGLGSAASSVAVSLGCAMEDVKQAAEASPALFVPQLLYAGFFIRLSQIPSFLRWAQYLCSLKYAINLLALLEFNHQTCTESEQFLCDELLAGNDIQRDRWWLYMLALAGLFLFFRLVAAALLVRRARMFY